MPHRARFADDLVLDQRAQAVLQVRPDLSHSDLPVLTLQDPMLASGRAEQSGWPWKVAPLIERLAGDHAR